jgi:hypothetical protein
MSILQRQFKKDNKGPRPAKPQTGSSKQKVLRDLTTRGGTMIRLRYSTDCKTKANQRKREIDKSVYFELINGEWKTLSDIYRRSNAFLSQQKGFEVSLDAIYASLTRLENSGDAMYDNRKGRWHVRIEFTAEERKKAKSLFKKLRGRFSEVKLRELAKKSHNSISDLLCEFNEFAYEPLHRHRAYLRNAQQYLKENAANFGTLAYEGFVAQAELQDALSGLIVEK